MNVAGYCRVSTDREDQANSFLAQQRFFRAFITAHPDWNLYKIYADEGITGTNTRKRTEFKRMIQDAEAGKFQLIITKEISRFSRNILDTITYTRKLKEMGIGVLFMTENLNTLNPESEMLLTFMGTIAQEESRRTSTRVKWGQTRQMEQGVVFGHSLLGYDVRDGKMMINPEGAEIVRMIFQKYAVENKGTGVIAQELREAGYSSITGNTNWTATQVLRIIKNEKYAGDLVQRKTYTPDYLTHERKYNHGQETVVAIPNHHEAIVSRELWNQAQEILTLRNRCRSIGQPCSVKHLLSGKIVCGVCGAPFVARTKKLANGNTYRRWSCRTATVKGSNACNVGKLVREDDGINMIRTAFLSLKFDRNALIQSIVALAKDAVRAGERDTEHRLHRLEKEASCLEKRKDTVLEAFLSGNITADEMRSAKDRCNQKIMCLKEEIERIQNKQPEDSAMFRYLSGQLEMKNDSNILYKYLLESITVFQDKHLVLKFSNLSHLFYFYYGNAFPDSGNSTNKYEGD